MYFLIDHFKNVTVPVLRVLHLLVQPRVYHAFLNINRFLLIVVNKIKFYRVLQIIYFNVHKHVLLDINYLIIQFVVLKTLYFLLIISVNNHVILAHIIIALFAKVKYY